MHILFVTTYFEPDTGAAAVRLSRLARILQRRGHRITVLTAMPHYPQGQIADGYRGRFALTEDRDGLRVIRVWLWATSSPKISRKLVSQMSFMVTTALRGLAIPRPDVVLIEAQPMFTGLAGAFVSRFNGAPYVLNVSDLWPDHLLSVGALTAAHPVYRIARRVMDGLYRGAARIVAMSPAWAEAIQRYIGSEDRLRMIYNGVDLARFQPGLDPVAFRQKYGLGEGKLVSFIGTFATQYDFETTFKVVEQFAARPDVQFVFIGGGSQSDAVRDYLTRSHLTRVHWIDWIDHSEIPLAWASSRVTFWAMRDADLYHGTIPAKFYEALASGVPVAAAMEGVGADMVARSGGGLTVPCGDVDALTHAIQRLLDDGDLHHQCSQSGRAYAEAHFDPESVAAAYESALLSATIRKPDTMD